MRIYSILYNSTFKKYRVVPGDNPFNIRRATENLNLDDLLEHLEKEGLKKKPTTFRLYFIPEEDREKLEGDLNVLTHRASIEYKENPRA